MKGFFRELLTTAALALVIFFMIQVTVQTFVVVGTSMEPSLHDGERLFVNKLVYHLRQPQMGEVIVFQPPNNNRTDYIKRVIGRPGDTVEIRAGKVYVNGLPLKESFIVSPPAYTMKPEKVPDDQFFVLGDNRNNSNDSHNGWMVPRQNIVGKAWISFWPLTDWGVISDHSLQDQLVSNVVTASP